MSLINSKNEERYKEYVCYLISKFYDKCGDIYNQYELDEKEFNERRNELLDGIISEYERLMKKENGKNKFFNTRINQNGELIYYNV